VYDSGSRSAQVPNLHQEDAETTRLSFNQARSTME
jgi:hypothetical protein